MNLFPAPEPFSGQLPEYSQTGGSLVFTLLQTSKKERKRPGWLYPFPGEEASAPKSGSPRGRDVLRSDLNSSKPSVVSPSLSTGDWQQEYLGTVESFRKISVCIYIQRRSNKCLPKKCKNSFGDIEACRNEGVNIKFDLNPLVFVNLSYSGATQMLLPVQSLSPQCKQRPQYPPLSLVVRDAVY